MNVRLLNCTPYSETDRLSGGCFRHRDRVISAYSVNSPSMTAVTYSM